MLTAFLAETAAHGAEAKAPFPPFETWHMPSQLFWLALLFGVLNLVLSRDILPKIGKTLGDRADQVAGDLGEAARLNAQAVDAQKALELKVAGARAKARETGDSAKRLADAEIAAESARVDDSISRKLEAADARLGKLRMAAMGNVEQIATEAAEAMIERLGFTASKSDLKQAVSAALEPKR